MKKNTIFDDYKKQDYLVKFGVGDLSSLRGRFLEDLSCEQFAVLLAKREKVNDVTVYNVLDIRVFEKTNLLEQSVASLRISKEHVGSLLSEIENRIDVDTLIDVHTHPFSKKTAFFSHIDDYDEINFIGYLNENFPDIHYGSIVFSQTEYSARFWERSDVTTFSIEAKIVSPLATERIPSSSLAGQSVLDEEKFSEPSGQFHRGTLALGLDAMRRIVTGQRIAIVGVGGLGSIIAENLIHYGFQNLYLIDHDTLSLSNLNRVAGATYADAKAERPKVGAIKEHLEKINPEAQIIVHATDILKADEKLQGALALCDWVIVATDNHSSRFKVQNLCLQYFTPFISAGVNITVDPKDGVVKDMSGEVITVRPGDNLCLSCLKRLDPQRIAAESHTESMVREGLVEKGYVSGLSIKEPAVKTLNSIVAAMTADVLANHYTERQKHESVWVYEDNVGKSMYPDHESVLSRSHNCHCHIF
jgi:molybdopterin/thiamine biosynthesis adenylyltransferase